MKQTLKTVVIVIITAVIVDGGVYLWQTQNLPSSAPTEESESWLVNSIQGTIKYGNNYKMDGSAFLIDEGGHAFTLQMQEPTKLKGIIYDESVKVDHL